MRAYNTQLKERHQVTLTDFKGVDYSSSPMKVAPNRASEMSNFIYRDGNIQKRYGWEQIDGKDTTKSIDAVHFFSFRYGKSSLAGYKQRDFVMYIGEKNENDISTIYVEDVNTKKSVGQFGLYHNGTRRWQFFQLANKLYIIGGVVAVFTIGKDERVGHLDLFDEDSVAYAPITTISIDDTTATTQNRVTLEAVNLLTNKRRNKLVGTSKESATWELDATPLLDDFTIDITIELTDKTIHANNQGTQIKIIDAGEQNGVVIGNISGDKLTLNQATTPPIAGRDNIEIEFIADIVRKGYISYVSFGTMFGINGNSDRLFLRSDVYKNRLYYSEPFKADGTNDAFDYFPDNNYISLGSSATDISAILRLQDNLLAVFKSDALNSEANVYYVSGKQESIYDSEGNLVRVETKFPAVGSVSTEVPINEQCVINFGNDHLMLSKNGVFALQLTQNLTTSERNVYSRSNNINKRLGELDKSHANFLIDGDRLILAVDGEMFICDQRYLFMDKEDGSRQYEWWRTTNTRAVSMDMYEDTIYFCNEKGVFKFNKTFEDLTYKKTLQGQITASVDDDKFTFDSALSPYIKEDTEIKFTIVAGDIEGMVLPNAQLYGNSTNRIDAKGLKVYLREDEEVILRGGAIGTQRNLKVKNFDGNSFQLYNTATHTIQEFTKGGFNVVEQLTETYLIGDIEHIVEQGIVINKFKIYDKRNLAEPIDIYANNTLANGINSQLRVHDPVVATWYTAVMDLGTNTISKTLTKMTISVTKSPKSKVKFGYETRKIIGLLKAMGTSSFNFDDIDFDDFTFETDFASAYSQRVNVRNFNYIIFRFVSDNNKNCAINDFTIEYKYNKNNRGVN